MSMERVATAPPLPPKTRRGPAPPPAHTASERHVVKIRISPDEDAGFTSFADKVRVVHQPLYANNSCIRININNHQHNITTTNNNNNTTTNSHHEEEVSMLRLLKERPSPYFFCGGSAGGLISSGQTSPSDTLDSGTGSDLDGGSPPPPLSPAKKPPSAVTVIVNGGGGGGGVGGGPPQHKRNCSLASSGIGVDTSEDEGSDISCDSLNGHELSALRLRELDEPPPEPEQEAPEPPTEVSDVGEPEVAEEAVKTAGGPALPLGLLQDIRERPRLPAVAHAWPKEAPRRPDKPTPAPAPPQAREEAPSPRPVVCERTYEDRTKEDRDREAQGKAEPPCHNYDSFYTFHLNEKEEDDAETGAAATPESRDLEDTFAGVRNFLEAPTVATIRSARGTVRGVRNRVRAGIATFLHINADKGYKEKEVGKVVLYTTTMGVVRATFHECLKVKQILRTLMVKFEERDVFMSREVQTEIRERLDSETVELPQLFVEGQLIGDAETVERLNETGELRKMLKPFKSADACRVCGVCGGYRLLPCPVCNGSKKSVHRNDFTAGFVALKCMNCDEVGLVRCHAC